MRKAFTGLATLLMVAVVAQFFLAASGAFDTAPIDESFQPHRAMGFGIILFTILLTVFAAVTRMPGRLIGMTGLVAGLTALQSVIRAIAESFGDGSDGGSSTVAGQIVFGLHAVNGLAIIAVIGMIIRQARELSRSVAPVQPVS
ncbi:MAG: DUF6220 domain-containing protein [Labedaea sp.]